MDNSVATDKERVMNDSYEIHELCKLLPSMRECNPEEYETLVADMREHGYDGEPVVLYQGKVLDGRNRYEAWQACGGDGDIPATEFVGNDHEAWQLVKRKNFARRHLTQFQRALIELQHISMATLGSNKPIVMTERQLAEKAGVSRAVAARAQHVTQYLDDETVAGCIAGTVSQTIAEAMIDPAMEQKTKAEKDAEDDRAVFYGMLSKVKEGKYTRESLAKVFELQSPGQQVAWFIRCCELAPDVTVIRDYGQRKLAYFEFRVEV